jgi:Na+-transporting methylmalonyl-CoA/oxaloacetate decarboxylase gamma subunit
MYINAIQLPEAFDEGLVITLVGYSIVFSALVVLYFVFSSFGKILNTNLRNKLRKEGKHEIAELPTITGEETAAISMALYLYNELHDKESNIITIKKVSKTYSPWSSKIYGIRNFPR